MAKNNKNFMRRKKRVRHSLKLKVSSKLSKMRLSVFRSGKHIYAQIIDDMKGVTVVSASTLEKNVNIKNTSNIEAAKTIGRLIAEKALKVAKEIEVYFDRGGYIYHGRVKALADSAREAGLKF